jgi:hypothetical protein
LVSRLLLGWRGVNTRQSCPSHHTVTVCVFKVGKLIIAIEMLKWFCLVYVWGVGRWVLVF